MSNSLEEVFRPFQSTTGTPAQQYFQQGQVGVPPVILRIGRTGQGKLFNGSVNFHSSNYMTQYVNEKAEASFGTAF